MNNRFYKTLYYVDGSSGYNVSKDLEIYQFDIIETLELLQLNQETRKPETLIIKKNKYANIALEPIHVANIDKLLLGGACIMPKSLLYEDTTDALIQMAFMASKYMVEPSNIYKCTQGWLSENQYKKLLKYLYEEFPEKYI